MKTMKRLTLCALFALCSLYASAVDPLGSRVSYDDRDDNSYLVYFFLVIIVIAAIFLYGLISSHINKRQEEKYKDKKNLNKSNSRTVYSFSNYNPFEEYQRQKEKQDKEDRIGCGCALAIVVFVAFMLIWTNYGFSNAAILLAVIIFIGWIIKKYNE